MARPRTRSDEPPRRPAALLLAAVTLAASTGACDKFEARVEFKQGNAYYAEENYREALRQFQRGLELDPEARFVWRSVGLSALALYRPGVEGAENAGFATTAIDAFERYLETHPDDAKVEEYLVSTLLSSGRFDAALSRLEAEARERPGDAALARAIVNTLLEAGRLPDALARARADRSRRPDPVALHAIGVAAWKRAYEDASLAPERRAEIVELGLDALRQALEIDPRYGEAMAYYNLLWREKAKLTADPFEAQRYYALAEEWMAKATALQKQPKTPPRS